MTRAVARLVVLTLMTVPVAVAGRQTFLPNQPPQQQVNFKTAVTPNLSITTEPGDLPIRLHHISGSGTDEIDVRARRMDVSYTKAGLSINLTGGTLTTLKSPWQSMQTLDTLHLELATSGELLWTKVK